MIRRLPLPALLGLSMLVPAQGRAAEICAPQERVVFACSTGSKSVRLCEAPRTEGEPVRLSYRFGAAGQPAEMEYPARDSRPAVFSAGLSTLSGGGGAWIEFTRGAYRYVVYSFSLGGQGMAHGVAVEKGGKRLATRPCRGEVLTELGPDYFADAGISLTHQDFLP